MLRSMYSLFDILEDRTDTVLRRAPCLKVTVAPSSGLGSSIYSLGERLLVAQELRRLDRGSRHVVSHNSDTLPGPLEADRDANDMPIGARCELLGGVFGRGVRARSSNNISPTPHRAVDGRFRWIAVTMAAWARMWRSAGRT
jgi:hypothetical protein